MLLAYTLSMALTFACRFRQSLKHKWPCRDTVLTFSSAPRFPRVGWTTQEAKTQIKMFPESCRAASWQAANKNRNRTVFFYCSVAILPQEPKPYGYLLVVLFRGTADRTNADITNTILNGIIDVYITRVAPRGTRTGRRRNLISV